MGEKGLQNLRMEVKNHTGVRKIQKYLSTFGNHLLRIY